VVVLIHGYAENSDSWSPLASDLMRDHTVVVPDLRGNGEIVKAHRWIRQDDASKGHPCSSHRARIRQNFVVAHGIGNMVAYAYAAMCPDKVDRLVVMDAPGVSALNAALPVAPDSRRFPFASHGMMTAAATRIAIPRNVGLGSLYPSRLVTEVTATKAASANSRAPTTRAACLSACSWVALARNLHSTTTAEKSSMALSPPKASRTGLRARQAAKRERPPLRRSSKLL
jgi:pimeloyl-ACP methyl ester carboxylesterase